MADVPPPPPPPGLAGLPGAPLGAPPCCSFPHGSVTPDKLEAEYLKSKIARAMASGPRDITKDATIAEWHHDGTITILRQGTNEWIAFPGNENEIGNVPMCANPMGLQWARDIVLRKPAPTNTAPGLIYMLCGATQHSNVDPFDHDSPAIPIGPHYMITWPFNSKRDGIPNDVRDKGAWIMYDNTPFAYLHICGSPWEGTSYHPETAPYPIWTMRYAK